MFFFEVIALSLPLLAYFVVLGCGASLYGEYKNEQEQRELNNSWNRAIALRRSTETPCTNQSQDTRNTDNHSNRMVTEKQIQRQRTTDQNNMSYGLFDSSMYL